MNYIKKGKKYIIILALFTIIYYLLYGTFESMDIYDYKINTMHDKWGLPLEIKGPYLTIKSKHKRLYKKSMKSNEYLQGFSNHIFPNDGISFMGRELQFGIFPYETINFDFTSWYQLQYIPEHIVNLKSTPITKNILFIKSDELYVDNLKNCPVNYCNIISQNEYYAYADVVIWRDRVNLKYAINRPSKQIWGFFTLESPFHTETLSSKESNIFNWTITYRRDSTISIQYYKFIPYDLTQSFPNKYPLPIKNYAANKTKMAAWFVSNCNAPNKRELIAYELSKYIEIDIFGKCGEYICPRFENYCFEKLNMEYKFYLAFENSNCRDYITEKFFVNGLGNNVIPIVMGAHPDDYKRVAPPYSYIHIDDFRTIKQLADYLNYLNNNDTAYNEYFGWKNYGKIYDDTLSISCRLCMMAHESDLTTSIYGDIDKWWHGDLFYTQKSNNHTYPGGSHICTHNLTWLS